MVLIGENIKKSLKISFACALSIATAYFAGVEYYITAGIITILSIQNTKMETVKAALNRAVAFVCALMLAAVSFAMLGYTIPAFCAYIAVFVLLCLLAGWPEAMAMDSVLISHFLTQQSMSMGWILNEVALFVIGTGFGIMVNLSLRSSEHGFNQLADNVDDQIKGILERMAERLLLGVSGTREGYDGSCFKVLDEYLVKAMNFAIRNWNNTFFEKNKYEIRYIEMRQKQSMVLKDIYKSIIMIDSLQAQRVMVARFIENVVANYRRDNAVEELLAELEQLFESMKSEKLPESRDEFEARAVLFYIMKQMEEFLRLKNQFVRRSGSCV